MKRIFLISLMASVAATAADYTVVNHSNKASPATVFAQGFNNAVGKKIKSDFYQAENCDEARQKFDKTPKSIMVYNADVGIAAMSKNLNCAMPKTIKADQLVFSGSSYFKICTNKKSPKDIKADKVTLGMASVVLSKGIIADYNSNGFKITGVPFGGSKDVLAAVINGDVDFGFLASSIAQPAIDSEQISCIYSTDPRESNFVGKTLKLKIADFKLWSLIYTNETDKKAIKEMREAAAKDPDFSAYLAKNSMTSNKTEGFAKKDIEDFNKWIKFNYETYWK